MGDRKKIETDIGTLQAQLTGDMMKDMALRDKIHNLKMQLKGVKPIDMEIDCIGCGS